MHPQNGQVFALASTSRLYGVDLGRGTVYDIGNGTSFTPLLDGTAFGMDFNPTVERLHIRSGRLNNSKHYFIIIIIYSIEPCMNFVIYTKLSGFFSFFLCKFFISINTVVIIYF